jgi:hypothetical protein
LKKIECWCLALFIIACSVMSSAYAAEPSPSGGARDTLKIPSDSAFNVGTDWFDGSACPGAASPSFYFQVGEAVFQAPAQSITHTMLQEIHLLGAPGKPTLAEIPRLSGCKVSPLKFALVELKGEGEAPERVFLAGIGPRTHATAQLIKYIEYLTQNQNCTKGADQQLMICGGSKTVNGQSIKLGFVVAIGEGGKMEIPQSGAPLVATCEKAATKLNCWVEDDIPGGVKAKASIQPPFSAPAIRKLREQLAAFVASHRAP